MVKLIFPVLAADNLDVSRSFYEEHFGLRAGFVSEWYLHLLRPDQPTVQLGLVVRGHTTIPPGDQRATHAAIIGIEVDDVEACYRRLEAAGVRLLGPPRDEAWGQRHFFAVDPAGFLVDVVASITPSPEYATAYVKP